MLEVILTNMNIPEIESIKHIGDMVDGKMVCREDCPSVTHRNTPDTEWREDFRNKILDIETAIRLTYNEKDSDAMVAKMTDYIATLLSSRDTYWQQHEKDMYEEVEKAHRELLEARDTYWKERVKRAVKKKQKQVSGEKRLNAGLPNTQVFLDGYNHALNDIITLIERV